jgi:hypothetical protein
MRPGEKVFVVGCNNCAWKCHSGGEDETRAMADRLARRGVDVIGYTVPGPQGMSLCKLDNTRKVLSQDYAEQVKRADSFLVLGCGQGVHIMPLGWTDVVPEILDQAGIPVDDSVRAA